MAHLDDRVHVNRLRHAQRSHRHLELSDVAARCCGGEEECQRLDVKSRRLLLRSRQHAAS